MNKNILKIAIAVLTLTTISSVNAKDILSDNNPPIRKTRSDDTRTNFQLGVGGMSSVLYLSRNVKENNDAWGYSIMANYGGHKLWRINVQYTFYKPIDIAPTWYNIHASTWEANLEGQARFKNQKSFLYPFAGLSYNTFNGFFTGQNDFLNLKKIYNVNETATSKWVGLNVGTSFEHHLGNFVLFVDYRMRIGRTDHARNSLNIMDVCYGAGVRYQFGIPTMKKIYKGLTDKYHWF